ncbi:MAG: hypothetical protein U0414_01330 [Polyangiaceae bacterium]
MDRDSFFGDPIVWTGRPKVLRVPMMYRVAAWAFGVVALISTLSAVAVKTALHASIGGLLLFAAWMATLALAFWRFPMWWRSELVYTITERNIVVSRGKIRRYIDRAAISYARIHWDPQHPGVGDLELVRAVPTGALRRRLTLVLTGLAAPDRVWAFVRGVTPSTPAGDGHRLLSQRLDQGERVLWSSNPGKGWRKWLPENGRALLSLLLGLGLVTCAVRATFEAVHSVKTVLAAGLEPESVSFIALLATITLSVALLGATAVLVVYLSVVRPARLERDTRYLITDRRVLIQRGDEELHLDRHRIVDVIDAPGNSGKRDVFLVLDGPKARAFAPSGAFGEAAGSGLLPVLKRVDDVAEIQRILRTGEEPSLPFAA